MTKKATTIIAIASLAMASQMQGSDAFAPIAYKTGSRLSLHVEEPKVTEAVFALNNDDDDDDEDEDEDIPLDRVEMLGRGAAKAKRGKRKSGSASPAAASRKAAMSLTPEETFYEGPPAISETFIPTLSILTVIGIIPAGAAWARQAWVRYKITTRRIRVTSGIGGNEMAEIVYPDIVEIRTVKRLFGDGDLVATLTDGAKFEMRNVPNFDDAMEFILKQVTPAVAKQYRKEGDVTTASKA